MRAVSSLILSIIVLSLSASVLLAQQTIVVNLDPLSSASSCSTQKDIALVHQPVQSVQSRVIQGRQTNAAYTSGRAKEIVIGRVGVISAAKARIQRTPSGNAQNLYTCPKETPLAIVSEAPGWYGVLMADSSTGWVEKSRVSMVDYQVMGTQTIGAAGGLSQIGASIVNNALRYLGIRYRWGGTSANGLDCSAFVRSVYGNHGISLPRVARDQARVGQAVRWDDLQAGDRLYFACKGGVVDHAGIYMGGGMFIHSSTGRGGVAIDRILTPLFARSLITARR